MRSSTGEEAAADHGLRRHWRALMVVDMVESVRLMQAHEDEVIARWRSFVHVVRTQLLPASGGHMVKSLGDGMLLTFPERASAAQVSLALHKQLALDNQGLPADRQMRLRIGLHWAPVLIDEHDVFGAGVNMAQRLCSVASRGQSTCSPEVVEGLLPGVDAEVEDLGMQYVKHVETPIRVFRLAARSTVARPSLYSRSRQNLSSAWG